MLPRPFLLLVGSVFFARFDTPIAQPVFQSFILNQSWRWSCSWPPTSSTANWPDIIFRDAFWPRDTSTSVETTHAIDVDCTKYP